MEPVLNLELLRTFAAVARTGELKQAAELICRSQGAVSMQMKRLEEQVGSELMQRNNRGVELTEAGRTLLSYSEQLLQLNGAALSALTQQDLSGRLSFGIPTDYAQNFLNFFMPVLCRELPNLEARIICDRSRNLRKKLSTGDLDIAIVAGEPESQDEMLLWTEKLVWSAPTHHRLEEKTPLPIALFEDNCIVRDKSIEQLKSKNLPHKIVFTSTVLENVASAVESGLGISLLPESLLNRQKTRQLPQDILCSNQVLKINMINSSSINQQTLERVSQCFKQAAQEQLKSSARAA